MKSLRRILLILLVVLMLPFSAHAAENSLTILHSREDAPISGAQFDLYRVDAAHTDAQSAYAAVVKAQQKPDGSAVTDAAGKAVFAGLSDGKYLLVGQPHRLGDQICEIEMSLLDIPGKDEDGNTLTNVTVQPKFSLKDEESQIEYRVIVLWEDEADPSRRPDEVSVELFRNQALHTTVTIHGGAEPTAITADGYNWRYSWTETDVAAVWAVAEAVPEGYTATYQRDGNTFIIINTLDIPEPTDPTEPDETKPGETQPPETTKPSGPNLPQTGQLWWPVPILALAGMILFLLGWIRRKESRDEA